MISVAAVKCSRCLTLKPSDQYYVRKSGKRERQCKDCRRAAIRSWRAAHPDRYTAIIRRNNDKVGNIHSVADNYRMAALRKRFYSGKYSASRRGVCFELTFEDYLKVTESGAARCHYCGGEFPRNGCGVDRMDNSIGYESGNVVPCCSRCNRMKGSHLSHGEMLAIWGLRDLWEGLR